MQVVCSSKRRVTCWIWSFKKVCQPDMRCCSEDVLGYLESCSCHGPDWRSWKKSECTAVLTPIWNVEMKKWTFFSLVAFYLLELGHELWQRGEADWAPLTHTLQYSEVILLWFHAPLSSRVLIFKSIFVFIFSHIKLIGLYSGSLKVSSFESWVKEIFKIFF